MRPTLIILGTTWPALCAAGCTRRPGGIISIGSLILSSPFRTEIHASAARVS